MTNRKSYIQSVIAATCIGCASAVTAGNMEVNVGDYLKPGMNDSQAVDAALYVSRNAESRTLIFKGKTFILTKAVELPSNTTVIIDNCTIKQADYTFDNIFRGNNYVIDPENPFDYVLEVKPLKNIRIIGKGNAVISGCDKNVTIYHPNLKEEQVGVGDYYGWRTHLIHFANLENFEIGNLKIEKSRCWAVAFGMSTRGHIHDIEFDTHVKNGDGLDLLYGCSHILVENITGFTSDDTVAIGGCHDSLPSKAPQYLYTCTPWLKYQLTLDKKRRDSHDIEIRNIRTGGIYHAIIMLCYGGAQMYNIKISDITDTGKRNCHLVDLYTGYGYGSGYNPGDIHDVEISNINGDSDCRGNEVKAALTIQLPVKNVTVSNIINKGNGKDCIITHPDGITVKDVKPEQIYNKLTK
ncbi:MAG: hypothetical protein E7050_07375 [Lentisphaerae bacterium]|nr:hypothetical protein [Lentisphaerota bacterium]